MKSILGWTEAEKALARQWVEAWRQAAPEMERLRRREIRQARTAECVPSFDGLFEAAVREHPPKPTSGLVEQQRRFALARR